MNISTIISIAQVVVSIIVVILILLQERGTDGGSLFGGGGGGGFYQARRGLEKVIFLTTIVFVTIFALLALANLLIK